MSEFVAGFLCEDEPAMGGRVTESELRSHLACLVGYGETSPPRADREAAAFKLRAWLEKVVGYRLARTCTHDADDVAQNVMVKIIQKARGWIDDRRPSVERAIRRVVDDEVRKVRNRRSRQPMSYEDDLHEPHNWDASNPANAVEVSQLRSQLDEGIADLPPKMAHYVRLRYFAHMTTTTIARNCGVTAATVSASLDKALSRLAKFFGRRDIRVGTPVIVLALIQAGRTEAHELCFQRLIDAAPSISQGGPVPPGALTPSAESLYAASQTSLASWKLSATLGLLTVCGCAIGGGVWWSHHRPAAVATISAPSIVEPPAPPPPLPMPVPRFQPGGFPNDPQPGQIHTLVLESLGLSLDFVWVPSDTPDTAGTWIGRTELTQAQWKQVGWLLTDLSDPANPSHHRGDSLPVEGITAEEAAAFVEHLSQVSGIPLRLPTAKEWELAAAAGAQPPYSVLTELELQDVAWYTQNSSVDGRMETHPVGMKTANSYNISDIYGNVFEVVTTDEKTYAICGGCWCYDATWCHPESFSAWNNNPRQGGVGLRLAYAPLRD